MSEGLALSIDGLTKQFNAVRAVDDLSFTVQPGRVTGFLGPNGSGKTTTLRCLLGLVAPTSGTVTIGGTPYADLASPARTVGAALEATGFHPGRTARNHARVLAVESGLPTDRAAEVLAQVGLSDAADRRVGGFSLGMRQRLQLACALLGDPAVLVLDEPANGLDPEGIAWLRAFLRHRAAQGRTVLVSSHVLSEVEQTVDDVVIIARGRLVRACPLSELVGEQSLKVLVRTPQTDLLVAALACTDTPPVIERREDGSLHIDAVSPAFVGHIAATESIELHELRALDTELEDVFLELTGTPSTDHDAIGGAS